MFDRQCVDIQSRNSLYSRKSILNADLQGLKTTISEAFSIVFVCPIVLKRMKVELRASDKSKTSMSNVKKDGRKEALGKVKTLICMLRSIVIDAQMNPDPKVDSASDLSLFNVGKGRKRLENLVIESKRYALAFESLAEDDLESARVLDKPNMHRFMELFAHTLPMFGSLKYIEELILEKGHQSAKKAVDMSNMKNE